MTIGTLAELGAVLAGTVMLQRGVATVVRVGETVTPVLIVDVVEAGVAYAADVLGGAIGPEWAETAWARSSGRWTAR